MTVRSLPQSEMSSSIGYSYGLHEFYKDKTILISGSTGFLGMTLVEKLIRTFPEIKEIIIIIRDKRGKTGSQRMESYFDSEVFSRLKEESPSSLSKVISLQGDISLPNCGLQQEEIEKIHKEVNLVIHSAATIKFNDLLKTSVNINVRGTLNMLKLCKEIQDLQCFIHVSTLYSNCQNDITEEKIYQHPITPEKLIDLIDTLDDATLEQIAPILIGNWTNNYTYTKNAAENLVYSYRHFMPVVIFRPSIITAPYKEPIRGWINKYMGPYGWITAVGLGLNRVIFTYNPQSNSNLIPCDYVTAAIIAVMWDMGVQRKRSGSVVINYTSTENPITWYELKKLVLSNIKKAPFSNCVWYPMSILVTSLYRFKIYSLFLQRIPAYISDFFLLLLNKKPRFVNLDTKIATSLKETWPFIRDFNFRSNNIYTILDKMSEEDKKELTFDVRLITWDEYMKDNMIGIKKYLLKDSMTGEAIRKANKNIFRLFILDKFIKIALLSIAIYLFRFILRIIL